MVVVVDCAKCCRQLAAWRGLLFDEFEKISAWSSITQIPFGWSTSAPSSPQCPKIGVNSAKTWVLYCSEKNWCGQYSMVITQLLLSEILKQAAMDSKISRARTWNQTVCNILPALDYCTFFVIMSYCGRHQPAPKPSVRCLKVFSPEATPPYSYSQAYGISVVSAWRNGSPGEQYS